MKRGAQVLFKICLWAAFIIVMGSTGLGFALYIYLMCMVDPWNIRTPSDQTLIMKFNLHLSSFEKLRKMLIEEEKKSIGSVSLRSAGTKIEGSRGAEYVSLIKEIGSLYNTTSNLLFGLAQFIFAECMLGPI